MTNRPDQHSPKQRKQVEYPESWCQFFFLNCFPTAVLDRIDAAYHDKPLIFNGLGFRRSSSPIFPQGMKFVLAYLCEMQDRNRGTINYIALRWSL